MAAFDRLSLEGQLQCPRCGNVQIEKELARPAVHTRSRANVRSRSQSTEESSQLSPGSSLSTARDGMLPTQPGNFDLRQLTRQMWLVLKEKGNDVGSDLPSAARDQKESIDSGEPGKELIYGTATEEEVLDLEADGIRLVGLPSPPDSYN